MANKNRLKKLFDRSAIEPADTQPKSSKPAQDEQEEEASLPLENLQETGEATEAAGAPDDVAGAPSLLEEAESEMTDLSALEGESIVPEQESTGSVEETSEDLLEDVRRSLIEEETEKDKKESRWWRRLGKRGKQPEPEPAPVPAEIDFPVTQNAQGPGEAVEHPPEEPAEPDEIEDLIHMLEAEEQARTSRAAPGPDIAERDIPTASEPEIDFDELKRQAFEPRAGAEQTEGMSDSDVRAIALEGGEEVLVEVEARPVDPMQERLTAVENAFKPYRRYIYTVLTLLGVAMAVTAILIMFNVYQRSRPQPVQEPSNLPYPTAVRLPGGWSFSLGRGTLQNGRWDPNGAEWLEGTEVCRWVALPWSTQLEAVIRTLNPKDPIELTMSNNDTLMYDVYSIRQMTPEQMQELDTNSPCLLLILTQQDAEARWVLTALP